MFNPSDTSPAKTDLQAPGADLGDLARLAVEAGASEVASEAGAVARRVAEGRFYVACVGQFKRGKSTLLNALVGRSLLPAGVVPVTSVPTVLRFGDRMRARVRFREGAWRDIEVGLLAAYVAEENNSENRIGVEAVEVFVPSPLLSSGLCLVDTPGVGSILAANTEATRAFVPQVDAAIVVLGADPPISGEEMALVGEIAARVDRLLFVLNKADRLPPGESAEAARFTERALRERLGARASAPLLVSATEVLDAGPSRDWETLERSLSRMARESGADLVRGAERRALSRLASRLLDLLDERRDALVRPIAETERRLEALAAATADAGRSMGDLGYLLAAEVDRLSARLAADRETFLAAARVEAPRDLAEALDATGAAGARERRARALESAVAIARARLDLWLATEQPAAESLYRAAAERFLTLGNEFLRRFLASGEIGPESLPAGLGHEAGFRARSGLFYTDLLTVAQQSAWSWLADRVRSAGALRRAVERDTAAYLEHLLQVNSARVQNDLIERVRESRRRLEAEIRARLSEAVRSAASALERANARRAEGEASVAAELSRLQEWRLRARRIGGDP
ncbi:MAG TPA: dynamin family protein [Thermoanaerobaculia bacterium]|nr:dynamin family protein [Thermoanaerobaculia bacterium]